MTLKPNDIHRRGHDTRDWAVWGDWCPALRARGVMAAGFTELGLGYEILRYSPEFPHVGACVEGEVDYFVSGHWQPVKEGMVLVAPVGAGHGSRRISPEAGRGKTAWVLFDPIAKRPNYTWDHGDSRLLTGRDVRPLWWAVQGLQVEANAARADHENSPAAVGQWCDLVVGAALRLVADQSLVDRAIFEVWEQIDGQLGNPWSAAQIARKAGFSETHFRRLCRSVLGRTPGRHLTHLSMQRAAMLLSTTQDKLQTISGAVGYEDVFAFSVAFKRWSGVAPSGYRNQPLRRI